MCSDALLEACNLTKSFKLFKKSGDRLREAFSGKIMHRDFIAVNNASFSLQPGKILGIIGENGSGKSTMLKLIAGVLIPDSGEIKSSGKIAGLLELGTGFNPELSGRRNIYLNGVYLHMTREQLKKLEKSIIEFSELEDFIDDPLKNYSSGMVMRLAFAIAIHADPSCFIIDEALSVGDVRFQQKCFDCLRKFRDNGGSILFVSHDLNAVKLLCDKVMVMHHGSIIYQGEPDDAVNQYNELMASQGNSGTKTKTGYGNGAVRFTSCEVLDKYNKPAEILTSGEPMTIQFSYECHEPVNQLTFGFTIRDRFGQDVYGTNGALLGKLADINADGQAGFHIPELNIGRGIYTINLAAHTGTTHLENCYHWWDNAAMFEVVFEEGTYFGGHTRLNASLKLNGEING